MKRTIFFSTTLLLLTTWGVIWSYITIRPFYFHYFTNQSVLLVWLTSILVIFNKTHTRFFKYLSVIALISIFITMSGFHILLDIEQLSLHFHLTHTIIPIAYILYYYLFIQETIRIQLFWITLLHPLIYLISMLIYGSISNWFPYPFIDISIQPISSVLIFVFLILTPIYTLVSYGLIIFKVKVNQ